MKEETRRLGNFQREHLGIDLDSCEEDVFYNTLERYKDKISESIRKYGRDRPPKETDDYHEYVRLKKTLAKYFVHCKDENFKKVLLTQHPEFGDL